MGGAGHLQQKTAIFYFMLSNFLCSPGNNTFSHSKENNLRITARQQNLTKT